MHPLGLDAYLSSDEEEAGDDDNLSVFSKPLRSALRKTPCRSQRSIPTTSFHQEHKVPTTSFTFHGLKEFTKYKFRIEAVNNNGAGPSSDSVVVRTESDVHLGPPTNVTVLSLPADSVMVRWSPPLPKQRNVEITSYKLRFKFRDPGSRGHVVSVEGHETRYVLSNLERGEAYLVQVAAVTIKGQGPYSAWVPVEVAATDHNNESQPPGAPTSLRLQARSNEVLVYWTPPLDDGLVIRGYLIGWGINMPDIHQERVDASGRYFAIKNLRPGGKYVISLRAYNKLGNGFPIYETVRTLDVATPGRTQRLSKVQSNACPDWIVSSGPVFRWTPFQSPLNVGRSSRRVRFKLPAHNTWNRADGNF